jgi:tRNA G18 (ribose-2'-O)-methylase SpoU
MQKIGKLEKLRLEFLKEKWHNSKAKGGCHEFILVLDHLLPDFNIGKIFRTADVLGCRAVYLIGVEYFDPAPALGSFKNVPAIFFDGFEECRQDLVGQGYTLIALEPEKGELLNEIDLPLKSAFVLGHEGLGLSFRPEEYAQVKVARIPQFGQAQSLNVSVAASIAAYEWVRQHGHKADLVSSIADHFHGRQ